MMNRFHSLSPAPLIALLLALAAAMPASAQVGKQLLYVENFEGLPLGPPVDEPLPGFANAFTHDPPPGWVMFDNGVPGVGNPDLGVQEWEGWSFTNIDFWREASHLPTGTQTPRDFFLRGQGTIAVADPDQWNDLGNPANVAFEGGYYNTLLRTPSIPTGDSELPDIRLKLGFDSSWVGGQAANDGVDFRPPQQPPPFMDNQTAIVRAIFADGSELELLRWEAARFRFIEDPSVPAGDFVPGVTELNPLYKPPNPDERVWLDLEIPEVPPQFLIAMGDDGTGGGSVEIEFIMEGAGNDGYWGLDNVEAFTIDTVLGDMNVNGMLDEGDVGAFALGLLSVDAYQSEYYFEYPVTRGSVDGTFDFDDIDWFVDYMNTNGVPAAADDILALLNPVPEPTAILLFFACAVTIYGRLRTRACFVAQSK